MPFSLLVAASLLTSQTDPAKVKPQDVDTVDHIVAALYDVISGPIGKDRDWDRMRTLFDRNATMGAIVRARNNQIRQIDITVERYIELDRPIMMKEGFFERETRRRENRYQHLVQVFSTYESRHALTEKPFERGVNSIVLFNDDHRWWIKSILWEGEEKPSR